MALIYRSLRVGKHGKPFHLYKLRTMKENGGVPTASMNDPRLTKTGKWLRRLKLDELPTLWNVLNGNISLCGPRPDTPEEIATLDGETKNIVLSVKPGIISPATLWNYKEDETLADKENPHEYYTQHIKPTKYALNAWYVQHKTLWLDLKIITAYILKFIGIKYLWLSIYPKDFYARKGE